MNQTEITRTRREIAQRFRPLGLVVLLSWQGSSAVWAAESIHDLELGIKAELPALATPMILGPAGGESQLHFGFQAEAAYALTDHLYFTSELGTRRQFLLWSDLEEDPDVFIEARTLRALVGLERSFTEGPTFFTASGSLGFVSAYWGLESGAQVADRVGRGGSATLSGGVDHFLTPRMAVSAELRLWGELYGANEIALDARRFENPPYRTGLSALAGFTFR